jgi:hypothetical protein
VADFGGNAHDCPHCSSCAQEQIPASAIDCEAAGRMVAVLCASILAAAAGETDHTKVLATSDIYLDFIRPRTLHVDSRGEVRFGNEEEE